MACSAASVSAPLLVRVAETVWITSSVMEEAASASVKMTVNVLLFTAVRMVSVSRSLDAPMMLTVEMLTPVWVVTQASMSVRMPVLAR